MDESPVLCLVPPELAELGEVLDGESFGNAPVEVLVDRRRRERREGADRRRGPRRPPAGIERRLSHDLEGRRFAERRAALVPVEDLPPLPAEARPHAEHLRFVKRVARETENREVARLRALTREWRRRTGVARGEAVANLLQSRGEARNALTAALEARDPYTWEHSAAVVWLALSCASEIGLSEEEEAEIHDVALLHDIGKLGIPDTILSKPGQLSDVEWEVMRQHPVIGARLIDSVEPLQHLGPAIRAEHERWDGRGYPDGLAGEEIPIASRIVFACDAYHAMVSDRPYRQALSPQAARAELARNLGTQFWSEAAGSLLSVLSHGEPRDRLLVAAPREAEAPRSRPEGEDTPAAIAAELEDVRAAASREAASDLAVAKASALSGALEGLLDATRRPYGYTPGVLLARALARACLRAGDRFDVRWKAPAQFPEARAAADNGTAEQAALARSRAVQAALERLLDATRAPRGYAPEAFLARARAEALLEDVDHV